MSRYKTKRQNALNRAIKILDRYREIGDSDIPDTKIYVREYEVNVNGKITKTCIRDEFDISISYLRTILGWNIKKMQDEIDKM
jgi:hypothetical protein